jgi:hypothetical protein
MALATLPCATALAGDRHGLSQLKCGLIRASIPYASAVAQGTVVRDMSASYGRNLKSTLRRNQIPSQTIAKIGTLHHVVDLNLCANFNCQRLDRGAPRHT